MSNVKLCVTFYFCRRPIERFESPSREESGCEAPPRLRFETARSCFISSSEKPSVRLEPDEEELRLLLLLLLTAERLGSVSLGTSFSTCSTSSTSIDSWRNCCWSNFCCCSCGGGCCAGAESRRAARCKSSCCDDCL